MMLKATRGLRPTVIAATTLIVAAFSGLASAGSAFADRAQSEVPILNGVWAPLNRCPVDDPAMLAVTGKEAEALCSAENSPSGSMTFGNFTVPFKHTNHQYGVEQSEEESFLTTTTSPPGGVLDAEPVELPGGIRGLLCPSRGYIARHICLSDLDHSARGRSEHASTVFWKLESAGKLTNFQILSGLVPGLPIATVPLKIHLQNRFLGRECYIGSEAEPIVTMPASTAPPETEFVFFAGNGTLGEEGPLTDIKSRDSQNSSGFTVPAASGCGPGGVFDQLIDRNVGLPSSASTNSLTFNEGASDLVGITGLEKVEPNDGKVLSEYWHSAVLAEPEAHGSADQAQQRGGHRFASTGEAEGYMRQRFQLRH